MYANVVSELRNLKNHGARFLIANGHSGQQKIKVKYGFLHLRTKRFVVDAQTMVTIKQELLGSRAFTR